MTIGQNTILTSTVTSTNDSCNALCDGTAEINIFGGTFPYNYSWTGGQTTSAVNSLCAGTFTITVTDAIGCLRIDSAIISQPTVLTSSVSVINPMCNNSCDGSASAFPSGGTSPYSYLWNPGGATTSAITGLCASNYTLTVTDAHHCSSTNTFVLTNPIVLSSTYTVTNSACSNVCNGAINITPSGGTGADTYHWMLGGQTTQNISGLCTGNDSVTITDTHGCSVTYSMTVSATISVIAHAGKDTSFCSGGTVILCNSSTNATSIAWYQIQNPTWTNIGSTNCVNENPFLSTDYALIATNGMCNDTDTIAVTIFPSPSVSAGSNTTILAGGTAQLNGSGSGTFLWSPSTGLSCTTCANPSASPTVSTTYTLVVTDGNGCTSSDSVKVILVPVIIPNDGISPNGDGKNDTWVIPGIDLYPECVVDVYNRWGQLIFSQTGYKNSSGWDGKFKGKDLSVGTYYYTINLNSASSPTPITGPITIMR
jgi:gliding motility-associated-like protein